MSRPRLPTVAAVALVVAGGSLLALGSALEATPAAVAGGNAPIDGDATHARSLAAHDSPSVSRSPVDPANLAVADRIDQPSYSCALHVSNDGGASWRDRGLPFPAGEEEPARCYAPDVAFGADGVLYVAFVTLKGAGNTPNAGWIVSSTDNGRNLSTPHRVLGPLAFQVRLTADPDRPARLYLSWLQAEQVGLYQFPDDHYPALVTRSDDRGETWNRPVAASSRSRSQVLAPSLAIGRGNSIYVAYLELSGDALDYHGGHEGQAGPPSTAAWRLVVSRSEDAGESWRESVAERAVVPIERFVVFIPPSPSLAVDRRSGMVYVAFHDGRLGDPDAWLWASADGGASFRPAVRVNDTPARDRHWQYLPKLSVAPNGRLDVVYYDRRADRADVRNEVSLQSSTDAGRSFSARVLVSDRSFDSRIGPDGPFGLANLGNGLGLVSTSARVLAVWTDTRAGSRATGKQDVARAVVVMPKAPAGRGLLLAGGAVLCAVGLAGLLATRWRSAAVRVSRARIIP